MRASLSTSAISVEPDTCLMPQHVKQYTCTHIRPPQVRCLHTHKHTYVHTCTQTHAHTGTRTHIHTRSHMHMYTLMYKGHTEDQRDPAPTIWPGPSGPKSSRPHTDSQGQPSNPQPHPLFLGTNLAVPRLSPALSSGLLRATPP